ncbi:MAG: M20/M25/M40 family metallo-hydrolase [Byssovorax sp.]
MRASLCLLSLSILALITACGPPAAPLAPPPPLPSLPSEASSASPSLALAPLAIDPDPAGSARIAADITYLASPELAGRGTGEPGAVLARDFLVKRFTDLGLAAAGSVDGASFTQELTARVGAASKPPELTVTPVHGKPSAVDPAAARVADGSASGTASVVAVFVGHGIAAVAAGWDDYAGVDLAGKIAVILDGVPLPIAPGVNPATLAASPLRDFGAVRYKIRTAREHHASGVLLVSRGPLPDASADASSMGIPAVVTTVTAVNALFPRLKLADKSVWAPTKSGKPIPLGVTVTLTTRVDPVEAPAWNVAAILRARTGSPHAGEYVVVGAHYDHLGHGGQFSRTPGSHAVHPGADDNASGTALLLETARRLHALPRAPERNVLFLAFGAEEIGTIGSRYWVDHPTVPLASVTAMINADMVGRLRDDHLLVDGTGTAAPWPDLARAANGKLGLDLALGVEGFGASDHTSFTQARIPVAFLFTGVHDDYHQPTDTADKINSVGEERVTTFAARLALSVTQRPDRLVFVDAPADPHRGTMSGGFKVSLGTIPDYAFTGVGVRLSGVRPDAPAERGGIKAGDVIVKVGPHAITNIHDYMFALGDLDAGRAITVEVERAGARVSLQVIPAPGR